MSNDNDKINSALATKQRKQWKDAAARNAPPEQGSIFEGDEPEPQHLEATPLKPITSQ